MTAWEIIKYILILVATVGGITLINYLCAVLEDNWFAWGTIIMSRSLTIISSFGAIASAIMLINKYVPDLWTKISQSELWRKVFYRPININTPTQGKWFVIITGISLLVFAVPVLVATFYYKRNILVNIIMMPLFGIIHFLWCIVAVCIGCMIFIVGIQFYFFKALFTAGSGPDPSQSSSSSSSATDWMMDYLQSAWAEKDAQRVIDEQNKRREEEAYWRERDEIQNEAYRQFGTRGQVSSDNDRWREDDDSDWIDVHKR